MKKVFFFLAVAGMFGFAACNNNNTVEEDTTAMEAVETACEEVMDSTAVEGVAEEVVENAEAVVAE